MRKDIVCPLCNQVIGNDYEKNHLEIRVKHIKSVHPETAQELKELFTQLEDVREKARRAYINLDQLVFFRRV